MREQDSVYISLEATFARGDQIVLIIFDYRREVQMGDWPRMAMAGKRYHFGVICKCQHVD